MRVLLCPIIVYLPCSDKRLVFGSTGAFSFHLQVLHETEQPFIDQEVELLLKKQQALLFDLDLTHRQVSNTSTTFPDAQFGWQEGKVGLGYDAALVTMSSLTYGRLFLLGFHHPRHTMFLPRLQKMVCAAEERLGRRLRRRTELVEQRLRKLDKILTRRLDWLSNQLAKKRDLTQRIGNRRGQWPWPVFVPDRPGTTWTLGIACGILLVSPSASGCAFGLDTRVSHKREGYSFQTVATISRYIARN